MDVSEKKMGFDVNLLEDNFHLSEYVNIPIRVSEFYDKVKSWIIEKGYNSCKTLDYWRNVEEVEFYFPNETIIIKRNPILLNLGIREFYLWGIEKYAGK